MPNKLNVKKKVENSKRISKKKLTQDEVRMAYELHLEKVRKEVLQKFEDYRNTLKFLAADAPIEVLCLPKPIESALLANGCLRIYDVFNMDFTKIKGLGVTRIRHLTASLDQFFAML